MSLVLAAILSSPASAADVTWEGFYRARYLVYDSLSLSDSNAQAEGAASAIDHRMRLQPAWTLSEHAQLHAQFDVLAYTLWGDAPDTWTDPVDGSSIALAEADGVSTSGAGLKATRAWAEAYTGVGKFAVGRMPLHWGAGILWNDGNDPLSEYGDTADRVQFTTRLGAVFVMAAVDVQSEGYVGDVSEPVDDMAGLSAAFGFRSETAGLALLNNYRFQPSNEWGAYTGDLWGYSEIGPLRLELEIAGTVGGGNLDTGANDIEVAAFGAMLDAGWNAEKIGFGVQGGMATGDADPDDGSVKTFRFDRDHNVALMLFEEPLPTLGTTVRNDANGGRTTDAALSGEGVSNALYVRPRVNYRLLPNLDLETAYITATLAKGPDTTEGRKGYGHEIDVSLRYDPHPHLWVKGTAGVLIPGAYYSAYTDADLGGGFDRPAFGGRIVAVAEF